MATAVKLNTEFLQYLMEHNARKLEEVFGVEKCIYEEIIEVLELIQFTKEELPLQVSDNNITVFKYNDGDYGIEAELIMKTGKTSDLTLHSKLTNNTYQMVYRLLEVM